MDLSKFKTSDWLKVGGAVLMLVAYFLTWWKFDLDLGEFGSLGSVDLAGSEYFFTGTVPWLLLIAVGVITFLRAAGIWRLPSSVPEHLVVLAVAALSFLLVLIRFFSDGTAADLDRGIGLFLALIATIAVLVGAVLGFRESGGDFNDLKDMDKLKGQFGGRSDAAGSSAPPPPPPPASAPPPPPAPPSV